MYIDKDKVKILMNKISEQDLLTQISQPPLNETTEVQLKEIDKRKIIMKKSIKNLNENSEEIKTETDKGEEANFEGKTVIYLIFTESKHNNAAKLEESKIRHKKTPAIFLKNNFIDTIKGIAHSNRHDDSKKIKYPKHDANINPNVSSTKHKNYEHMNKIPLPQPEGNSTPINNVVMQVDQRREVPRQGYTNSGTDSKESGGIQNPLKQSQDINLDISMINPSYQQINRKPEDRNALSQDCVVELNRMCMFENFNKYYR